MLIKRTKLVLRYLSTREIIKLRILSNKKTQRFGENKTLILTIINSCLTPFNPLVRFLTEDDEAKEQHQGVHETKMGEDDVHLHVHSDHGTGGHWCAKIFFFALLAILIGLTGIIILENQGSDDGELVSFTTKPIEI